MEKPFRHIIRDRILGEMLRSAAGGTGNWKVLITDAYTLRAMSSMCKLAEITEEGISLVEDLSRSRQPQPSMEALYFIQPSPVSISLFLNDMQGRAPLYKRAHVYFSRPVSQDSLQAIRDDPLLRSRIVALREMNLEFLTVDIQGFVTENSDALVQLFGGEMSAREYERTIDEVAGRLATVFASIKELPAVRYRAAKSGSAGSTGSAARMREMVPTKLAAALWDRLATYKQTLPDLPKVDTCDLLILDRASDPVAPIIHDWSYGGMCFDLLPVDGNKYEYETEGAGGKRERKTVLLDEHDPVWLEVRDLFLAEAYNKVKAIFDQLSPHMAVREGELSQKELQELVKSLPMYREQKDKVDLHVNISSSLSRQLKEEGLFEVGKLEQGFVFGDPGATYRELSALLKDREEMSAASKLRLLLIYAATHPDKLDQAKLAFWAKLAGLEAGDMAAVGNLEFLGIPLGPPDERPAASVRGDSRGLGVLHLSFGTRKAKAGAQRKERKTAGEEEAYELSRFYPVLQDILEDMHSGKLPVADYPYVQQPAGGAASPPPQSHGVPSSGNTAPRPSSGSGSIRGGNAAATSTPIASDSGRSLSSTSSSSSSSQGGSARSNLSVRKKSSRDEGAGGSSSAGQTPPPSGSSLASWALRGAKGPSDSAGANSASGAAGAALRGVGGLVGGVISSVGALTLGQSGPGSSTTEGSSGGSSSNVRGRRLVVFVVGGMTRSEIRTAHLLSKRLNREVLIGSTSLDTPLQFLEKLKRLRPARP